MWLVAFSAVLSLMLAWGQDMGVKNDFTQNVWLPSRLLLDGADLYNPSRAAVDVALGSYASDFDGFNSGVNYNFIYPTWVAVAFSPFALLPLSFAMALWRTLNLLLLVWGVSHLLRSANPSFRSGRVAAVTALTLTVFLSLLYRESILTLILGQFSILEFGLLVGIWAYLARGKQSNAADALVGLGLAVLATKPQALALPVLLLGLWAISRKRWAIPVSAAVSLAALLFLPLLAYPASLGDWLGIVLGGQAGSQMQVSASVWGVSYHLLGDNLPWQALALLLSLAGLALLVPHWRRDLLDRTSPVPMSLALTLVINSVISPYMLGYEHVLLLIPAVLMLAAAGLPDERPERGWKLWRIAVYTWMAAVPFIIVAVQSALESKEYPVIAQSLSMLALLYVARLRWNTEDAKHDFA